MSANAGKRSLTLVNVGMSVFKVRSSALERSPFSAMVIRMNSERGVKAVARRIEEGTFRNSYSRG